MTNITKLYQQLQEGKTTREYFVREARRQFPQFISPVTSFTDAVNILKSKRLVSENVIKEVSGAFFDAPPATTIDEATIKDLVQPLVAKLESMGFETEIDPYGGYKTLFAWKTFPNGNTLTVYVGPSDYELNVRDYKGFDEFSTIDVSFKYYTTEITKKLFGLYKSKKRVMQALPDEGGREIDLGVGMFDIPIEDSVERIASLVRKAEQKVESGQLNKSEPINEAHKLDAEQILDRMPAYAVKKGIEVELKKEKTYDNTTIDKIKERVARKLKKNPNAYDDQIIANVKKVEKLDKELEATELKKELVDKKNAMRKPKGFKADKANTKVSKRENRKGKPKGVKVMPDKGVTGTEKVIKEDVIQNLKEWLQENIMREYHPNMEVKTPYGDGVVKEIRGGTLTVELADKRLVDVQFNVVNELMDKANEPQQPEIEPSFKDEPEEQPEMTKAERDAAWAKIGTPMGSVEGPSTGVPKSLYKDMNYEEKAKKVMERFKAIKDEATKKKVMEMLDRITAKNQSGQEVTLDVLPSGQGNLAANAYKQKGAKSVKVTKIQ
jgi:hypothetical protein